MKDRKTVVRGIHLFHFVQNVPTRLKCDCSIIIILLDVIINEDDAPFPSFYSFSHYYCSSTINAALDVKEVLQMVLILNVFV